jgi:hypothetical protein
MISGKRDSPTPDGSLFLDQVAAITQAGDGAFAAIRALYEQMPDLHPPPE